MCVQLLWDATTRQVSTENPLSKSSVGLGKCAQIGRWRKASLSRPSGLLGTCP